MNTALNPPRRCPTQNIQSAYLLPGFEPAEISGIQILSSQLALQNVTLHPIAAGEMPDVSAIPYHTLYGIYPPKIAEAEIKPVNVSGEIVLDQVVVPEYVVVHDGVPTDASAGNYYVRYKDYIKNVACCRNICYMALRITDRQHPGNPVLYNEPHLHGMVQK